MKNYSSQEWYQFVKDVYDVLVAEIEHPDNQKSYPYLYPRLIVGIEFFRLLRGEAFLSLRPHPVVDYQKQLYDLEHDLYQRLDKIKATLNPSDPYLQGQIEEMKNGFSL